jgi:hypothetical protein
MSSVYAIPKLAPFKSPLAQEAKHKPLATHRPPCYNKRYRT